jgi:hypothetical protein
LRDLGTLNGIDNCIRHNLSTLESSSSRITKVSDDFQNCTSKDKGLKVLT